MKKLKITFLFGFMFLLASFCFPDNIAEAFEQSYTLTDYCTDKTYYISCSDDSVVISSDNLNRTLPVDSPVISCCINQNTIHFLSYTESSGTHYAAYYSFDTLNCNLTYTLSNLPIAIDESRFAIDSNNNLYLVDRYNGSIVNLSFNNNTIAFDLNSTVEQILCLDGENVAVITTKGIFLIDGTQAVKISTVVPVTPCVYTGNGTIEDRAGTKFNYTNGALIPDETEAEITETTKPSDEYNGNIISIRDSYIFTEQGVTVAKLYKSLGISKDALTVHKADGTLFSQGKLGTGMKVSFENKTYTIIIYGELTSEGNINSRDMKLLMKHLTGEEKLSPLQEISADINQDNKICTKDLLLLSRMY